MMPPAIPSCCHCQTISRTRNGDKGGGESLTSGVGVERKEERRGPIYLQDPLSSLANSPGLCNKQGVRGLENARSSPCWSPALLSCVFSDAQENTARFSKLSLSLCLCLCLSLSHTHTLTHTFQCLNYVHPLLLVSIPVLKTEMTVGRLHGGQCTDLLPCHLAHV